MKKLLMSAFFLIIMITPFKVAAEGGVTISPGTLNIVAGNSASFNITASNFIGDVSITTGSPVVATVSQSSWETGMVEARQTKTGTINVNGISAGTTTITVYIDGATYDGEDLSGQTKTITVNVTNPAPAVQPVTPTPTPTPTPPTNNNTNNGGATTNGNTNSNNANTNDNNNSVNANTETKTQETKTTEPAKKPIEVTKFEIVGYDLEFDSNTKSYTLNIGKEVSKLYLIVEGKDITADGTGIIDIANKDKVKFRLKNSDQEVEYTINLNKQSLGNSVKVTAKDKGNIFMATTVIFGWSTVILAFFLAKDIIKIRKQNKESL